MIRMSALVLAAAIGSYGTQGYAQTAGTRRATPTHAVKTHVVNVKQKSAKTVRPHKVVVRTKRWAPNGTADSIYSFTG